MRLKNKCLEHSTSGKKRDREKMWWRWGQGKLSPILSIFLACAGHYSRWAMKVMTTPDRLFLIFCISSVFFLSSLTKRNQDWVRKSRIPLGNNDGKRAMHGGTLCVCRERRKEKAATRRKCSLSSALQTLPWGHTPICTSRHECQLYLPTFYLCSKSQKCYTYTWKLRSGGLKYRVRIFRWSPSGTLLTFTRIHGTSAGCVGVHGWQHSWHCVKNAVTRRRCCIQHQSCGISRKWTFLKVLMWEYGPYPISNLSFH